jgi:hypothetical protein
VSECSYFVGLDLGQLADFSAMAIAERVLLETGETRVDSSRVRDGWGPPGWPQGPRLPRYTEVEREVPVTEPGYRIRYLRRWPLGTPYPAIVEHVRGRLAKVPGGALLGVDTTGVGAAVVDLFAAAELAPIAVTITAGGAVRGEGRGLNVPKRDLVHGLLVALQAGRFTYAGRLGLAPALVGGLTSFRMKVRAAGHDSYESWRESEHDDLVLAVAIAAWLAERVAAEGCAHRVAALQLQALDEQSEVRIGPHF